MKKPRDVYSVFKRYAYRSLSVFMLCVLRSTSTCLTGDFGTTSSFAQCRRGTVPGTSTWSTLQTVHRVRFVQDDMSERQTRYMNLTMSGIVNAILVVLNQH
jgi:hypothetical protein